MVKVNISIHDQIFRISRFMLTHCTQLRLFPFFLAVQALPVHKNRERKATQPGNTKMSKEFGIYRTYKQDSRRRKGL